jgi:adenine-specific DNA methylase
MCQLPNWHRCPPAVPFFPYNNSHTPRERMPLTAEQGYKIREEYSEIKEKSVCDAHGLKQRGGSRSKIDGENAHSRKSIKNTNSRSTQVHLTTQKHFIEVLNVDDAAAEFIKHFCGNKEYDYKGKDRRTTKQIEEKYLTAFKEFLDKNKYAVIDLIVRNGFDITHVVYNHLLTKEYELTYQQIIDRIDNAEWKFLSGGIHLKNKNGKTYFHLQREGKKNPSNRYNVLWHIHLNLFV